MRVSLTLLILMLSLNLTAMKETREVKIKVVGTSDVHGQFFPYDFINRKEAKGSMARISTLVNMQRSKYGNNVILLDNGDILQGQPACYYYNYVETEKTNIAAGVTNFMGYDAQTIGNHDVETGHKVYDKWISECRCPVLGANIIDRATGRPYLVPYKMIERDGVRIAVLGLITPAIPNWLAEHLWQGLYFEEMVKSAQHWMAYIKEHENADVIIGLFHSGSEGGISTDSYVEDATFEVAREVDGFDLIIFGHDHKPNSTLINGKNGHKTLCLNPGGYAQNVCDADITLTVESGHVTTKNVTGQVTDITGYEVDKAFMEHFNEEMERIRCFTDKKIGHFTRTISTRDSYFGNSAFTDFIHNLQLKITGADISFNAPLSLDASINEGDIYVSDMFNLYKYENQLYVMMLSGEEIRKHLEMSYDLWVNTMKSPNDNIMLMEESTRKGESRWHFKNLTFNFDSAAGIDYEVDVTRPDGDKVHILRMSDGKPFDEQKKYKVVMNSYRGNGGGELLTKGAGIAHEELKNRIVYYTDKDLRFYLMKEIEKAGTVTPKANGNWKFVPDEWTEEAIRRDRERLFK